MTYRTSHRARTAVVGSGVAGVDVTIERELPEVETFVARLWSDDVQIHRDMSSVPPHSVAVQTNLLSSEFGGRHYDVTVAAGPEEFRLRAEAAVHGGWLCAADEGHPVVIGFRPESMHVCPASPLATYRPLVSAP